MARILAKSLNCQKSPNEIPCNQCSSCLEISESRSMDVFEIDGASNRGIDEIRNLRENVRYAPVHGKFKIYIIDEVHMLTTEAFNALLKTLEEPPGHVLFIFATTEPQKVISTILSRCQRFDFRRIRIQEIVDRIHSISKKEGIQVDQKALRMIAQKADGSMRDGESMLDQLSSYTEGKIDVEDVRAVLGFFDSSFLFELTDLIVKQDAFSALTFIEKMTQQGIDDREFLPEWIEHLRTLLHIQLNLKTDIVTSLTESERSQLTQQASQLDTEKLLRILQIVSETENQMKRSDHPRILFESCMVRLTRLESTVNLKDLFERLGQTDDPEEIHTETPDESTENLDSSKSPKLESVGQVWKDLFTKIPKNKKGLSFCLQSGEPAQLNENSLIVTFPKEKAFERGQVEDNKNKRLLEDLLNDLLGHPVRIECDWNARSEKSVVEKAQEIFEAEVIS
jgi:DNA polymerase-3 subunit gamma/tau